MDHSEAARGYAVERYLLGEMNESEAETFELHFFECPECTQAIAAGAILAENMPTAPLPAAQRATPTIAGSIRAWWSRPLFAAPAFAAIALAVVVGYQARELARVNQPQAVLAYTLKAQTRGQNPSVPADRKNIEIRFDLSDTSYPKYRCDLYDKVGRNSFSLETPAPQAGDPLSISFPNGLAAGDYTLRVRGIREGQPGPEVSYRVEAVKP